MAEKSLSRPLLPFREEQEVGVHERVQNKMQKWNGLPQLHGDAQ